MGIREDVLYLPPRGADPDIDCVIIATSWNQHIPVAVGSCARGSTSPRRCAALRYLRVPGTACRVQGSGRSLMMPENCRYGRLGRMVLRMAREGKFGEIVHCSGGHLHFLPHVELFAEKDGVVGTDHYRLPEYAHRRLTRTGNASRGCAYDKGKYDHGHRSSDGNLRRECLTLTARKPRAAHRCPLFPALAIPRCRRHFPLPHPGRSARSAGRLRRPGRIRWEPRTHIRPTLPGKRTLFPRRAGFP